LIPDYYLIEIPLNWKDHVNRCRQDAEKYLAKMEKRLKPTVINIKTVVLMAKSGEGSSADYIVDYANNNAFDLLIMSTRGRSGLSRWAFGSVADKIIRRVSAPILLIKPQKE
jgi:nucleotide-binding universal stress UspA family protein